MLFENIIKNLNYDIVASNYEELKNIDIAEIVDNSCVIDSSVNSIFVAISGYTQNGINYIKDAIKKNVKIIVVDIQNKKDIDKLDIDSLFKDNKIIFVNNVRKFFAEVTFLLINDKIPQNILAVTGTNGKTSVVSITSQILVLLKKNIIHCGTLGIFIQNEKYSDSLTTPNPYLLKNALIEKNSNKNEYLILEASSQGISQDRISGLKFQALGFTNLTQDHLDYHGDIDNYFKTKQSLFMNSSAKNVVINTDDEYGIILEQECRKKSINIISYGYKAKDIIIKKIINNLSEKTQEVHLNYKNKDYKFSINLLGSYQIYNLCCAVGLLLSCGFTFDKIIKCVSKLTQIPGRLTLLKSNTIGSIFIDYAHTPDAIEEVLKNLQTSKPKQLKILFGCGGNRDEGKRALMGIKSVLNSDVVYVTDDNPRYEDPQKIRKQILSAIDDFIYNNKIKNKIILEFSDRKKAIEQAIIDLKENEILLIAGKGHEEIQIIDGDHIIFNETEICNNILKRLGRFKYGN